MRFRRHGAICSFLFLLFLLTGTSSAFTETDYFSPDSLYDFAQYLYEEGDYLRAAGEFQRYLISGDTTHPKDGLFFLLGSCYTKGGEYEKGLLYFSALLDAFPGSEYASQVVYEIAMIYYTKAEYEKSLDYLLNYSEIDGGNRVAISQEDLENLSIVMGLNYLFMGQWQKASDILPMNQNHLAAGLDDFAQLGLHAVKKSSFAAGLMSTFIPGTGKMYSGNLAGGLYSLVSIGLLATLSAISFYNEGIISLKGWIYASIGFVFHIGNIYGSAVSAQNYNKRQEETLLNDIHEFFNKHNK